MSPIIALLAAPKVGGHCNDCVQLSISAACPIIRDLIEPRALLLTYSPLTYSRPLKIHEYQAKELFKKSGVAVLRGKVAASPQEAAAAFKELNSPLAALKAQ